MVKKTNLIADVKKDTYLPFELNKVHNTDCLEGLKKLPDNSVDLVVTDPPYYKIMVKDHTGKKHNWDNQWATFEDYLKWCVSWFVELKRVLKDNGSLYIFGDDKIIAYVQIELDKFFKLENSIVWVKPNNMTIKGWSEFRSYAPITERLLFYSNEIVNIEGLCVNNARDYIRNEILEAKGKIIFKDINKAIGTATNGGGVASATLSLDKSEPTMITKEHYCLLRDWLNDKKEEYKYLRREYEDLRREFKPKENYTDVWTFNITSSSEKTFHPTQKPIKMLRRIIETSSRKKNVILDPFMGSGTTAVACKQLARDFIGFEISEEYCKIAEERLKQDTFADGFERFEGK